MPRYQYRATNAAGTEVADFVEATGVADAAATIESLGLTVLSITLTDLESKPAAITEDDSLAEATKRLFAARESIVEPLIAYTKESARGRRRAELQNIAALLSTGDELAVLAGAAAAPVAWGTLLAAAAPADGSPSLFERFVERERPVATLRRRRRIASLYPLAVAALCLAILWPLSSFVLPSFAEIFRSFGLELPGATRAVLAIGNFLNRGGALAIAAALLVVTLLRHSWRRWLPHLPAPAVGPIYRFWRGGALGAARLTTHVADMVEAGLPLEEATRLAGEYVYNTPDSPAADLAVRLSSAPLRAAIERQPARSLDYALAASMSTKTRVRLLRELSACHNERSVKSASWAEGIAGPFSIVTLGLVVGFVVLSLFMPLMKLIEGLT